MGELTGMGMPHKLTLTERKQLTVTGITEVLSFDDTTVALAMDSGNLMVHGQQLRLKTLSAEGGQVILEGQVSAIVYEEPRPLRGRFGRSKP